jgi:uncharacterized membrane protein
MTNEDTPQGPPEPPPAQPPPPPPPAEEAPGPPPSGGPVSDNRAVWIVLSYLGLLALIPLLVERDDREVQWHAKHGLVLLVAEIAVIVGLQIVVFVISAISGGLGCLAGLLLPVLLLAILVLHVVCIVKGLNGERFTISGLSDFADRL